VVRRDGDAVGRGEIGPRIIYVVTWVRDGDVDGGSEVCMIKGRI